MPVTYLDFEQPLAALDARVDELRRGRARGVEVARELRRLGAERRRLELEVYESLSAWERVQLARHVERPQTLDYIARLCREFFELRGDRAFGDDAAIVAGIGRFHGAPLAVVGHQRGHTTAERVQRNFGMANPEGYRKAVRVFRLAERLDIPILTLVDTQGAYPGAGAEARGQAEAIANTMRTMTRLTVPIVSVVIGEGGSGGALALAVADRVLMQQYACYSVISPGRLCGDSLSRPRAREHRAGRRGAPPHGPRSRRGRRRRRSDSGARRRRPSQPAPRRRGARARGGAPSRRAPHTLGRGAAAGAPSKVSRSRQPQRRAAARARPSGARGSRPRRRAARAPHPCTGALDDTLDTSRTLNEALNCKAETGTVALTILKDATTVARKSASDRSVDRERAKIDRIDERILGLLSERARVAQRIGKRKARQRPNASAGADGFWVPSREKRIFQRLRSLNRGPLADDVVRVIFREIISASRALEARLTIAFLGPEGTFTNVAAREVFGAGATLAPAESIADVFTEVEHRRADFGVVPVENSTEGAVTSTLDLLVASPLRITAEVRLDVEQCLLGTAGAWSEIRRVLSHPQGLAQCRHWLAAHLPHATLEAVASTSRAAELAKGDPAIAAVASRMAGERAELRVLAAKIQDEMANATRFFVLGHRDAEEASGDDKTSVVCTVKDQVGVLASLLQPLAACGVSLHKIESRPLRGRPWEYVFFLDLRGHRSDARVKRALARMTPLTTSMKILGSYPAA